MATKKKVAKKKVSKKAQSKARRHEGTKARSAKPKPAASKKRGSRKPATKTAPATKPAAKGRPKGSATAEAVIVDVIKSRCEACGSSSVAWSGAPLVRPAFGASPLTGKTYHAVRFTRKRCVCGQTRVEKEYLDREPAEAA